MADAEPHEFLTEAINAAKNNVTEAIAKIEQDGLVTSDKLLKIAEIQAEMAKAGALAFIGQQLSLIAGNLHGVATPGQSIRYGMADVASALSNLKPKEGS